MPFFWALTFAMLIPLPFQLEASDKFFQSKGSWVPISEKEGIKVFKMELSNSPLLALKAHGTIKASIESLLYIFRDVKGSLEWAPRLEERKILKNISESEAIVYEVRKLPWPCLRRDLILHNKLHFDKNKKALVLVTKSVTDFPNDPKPEDMVRAHLSHSAITMKPISDKETNVEVTIHVDPRGQIPSWIVNLIQKNWPYRFIKGMETRSFSITPTLGPELLNFASLAKQN